MAARGGSDRFPYVVRVTYSPRGAPISHHVQCRRQRLRPALEYAREAALAWSRLIGGQYPVLFWSVVDTRDGTVHTPSELTRGGASDGTEQESRGRLF